MATPSKPASSTTDAKVDDAPKSTDTSLDNAPKLAPDSPVTVAGPTPDVGPVASAADAIDPRTGQPFSPSAGFAGLHGFDDDGGVPLGTVPNVDPAHIGSEVTPGVQPDAGGDALLAAAQRRAPSLTAEFVAAYKLTDSDLGAIARGEVPPPPVNGPVHSSDLYLTPGGWVSTPPGVAPDGTVRK